MRTSTNCISPFIRIEFKEFMNLYEKCTAKSYSFLLIDVTLASDNSSCFRKNLKPNHNDWW